MLLTSCVTAYSSSAVRDLNLSREEGHVAAHVTEDRSEIHALVLIPKYGRARLDLRLAKVT